MANIRGLLFGEKSIPLTELEKVNILQILGEESYGLSMSSHRRWTKQNQMLARRLDWDFSVVPDYKLPKGKHHDGYDVDRLKSVKGLVNINKVYPLLFSIAEDGQMFDKANIQELDRLTSMFNKVCYALYVPNLPDSCRSLDSIRLESHMGNYAEFDAFYKRFLFNLFGIRGQNLSTKFMEYLYK